MSKFFLRWLRLGILWILVWQGLVCHASPQFLAFSQFFRRPVGPMGLEPTVALMSSNGTSVTLRGFAVRPLDARDADDAPWILSPMPTRLGDEDESLADDLPASVAYLHGLSAEIQQAIEKCDASMDVTGTLEVGRQRERDGRFSYVRLRVHALQCSEGMKS